MHPQDYQIHAGSPPIVVMKTAGKSPRRPGTDPPPRQYKSPPPVRRPATPPAAARQRVESERSPRGRIPKSPDRVDLSNGPRPGPAAPARRRPDSAATPPLQRRSPVNSPRTSPRRTGPDPLAARSPRNRHSFPPENRTEDDSSTTVSESSVSNSSHYDLERSGVEEHHRAGRSILERCDKLLSSIAAITSSSSEEQPSPISVLNASRFLGGDEVSPPPAVAAVDFNDQLLDLVDGDWSPNTRSADVDGPEDSEYAYVADIVRETERHVDTADLYAALEKRHQGVSDQRLLFDVVVDTLERKRDVPTWQVFSDSFLAVAGASGGGGEILRQVWAEVRRLREGEELVSGDLNDITCGAIRKDIAAAGDGGWGSVSAAEMSNAVLYIERQVFKDLVAEVIRELAAEKPRSPLPRRKLMF